jgi:hypothetical protein
MSHPRAAFACFLLLPEGAGWPDLESSQRTEYKWTKRGSLCLHSSLATTLTGEVVCSFSLRGSGNSISQIIARARLALSLPLFLLVVTARLVASQSCLGGSLCSRQGWLCNTGWRESTLMRRSEFSCTSFDPSQFA